MAVRPIIRQHYVRFRKVKAVTGVDSQHGFFASDDYIVRILDLCLCLGAHSQSLSPAVEDRQRPDCNNHAPVVERELGDGDFVESVLAASDEQLNRRYRYQAKVIGLEHLLPAVAAYTGIEPGQLSGSSKLHRVVHARNLCSYWAVTELRLSMLEVARRLQIALSTVSMAVPLSLYKKPRSRPRVGFFVVFT